MEWAFGVPLLLKRRLAVKELDAAAIAEWIPPTLEAISGQARIASLSRLDGQARHDLCRYIVEHYDGRTEDIWTTTTSGEELLEHVPRVAGIRQGQVAYLRRSARQASRRAPAGWEVVAADWPSIADVDTFERVAEIREKERAAKAAKEAEEAAAPKKVVAPRRRAQEGRGKKRPAG